MTDKTISNFWKPRLPVIRLDSATLVKGWSYENAGLPAFVEAPLRQNDLLNGKYNVENADIILVSAPGAVGKSTLAKEIAASTGAIYIDLAKSEPVGANTLIGGLAKSKLLPSWNEGTTAVLIDGLDEARLRVTQEAFAAFFADVAEQSKQRGLPTVLFGRTGSVEDAWLMLSEHEVGVAVFEIGYYDHATAVDFASVRLRELRASDGRGEIDRQAVELILGRLRILTEQSKTHDKFSGYAPVLQAVADRVFAENNPSALVADIEAGQQPITLQTVADAILQRERGKLSTLQFADPTLTDRLYQPGEQLDRLVSLVYDLAPPDIAINNPQDAQVYASALETWVAEHPFLKGNKESSSVVFEAVILNHALKNPATAAIVADQQLARGISANPFLSEFYLSSAPEEDLHIPAEHIGIIYSSMRARLALGDKANLVIDGSEGDSSENLSAEVEITIEEHAEGRSKVVRFSTDQGGVLRLGCYLEDISITAPNSSVEIGPGAEAVLIAPIDIQCAKLTLNANRLTVESTPGRVDGAVYLQAESVHGAQLAAMPLVRGGANLKATWPGVRSFPWTSFAASASPTDDPRISEALRRFRKFVIAFRSHSKGDLRRVAAKLDHARMTKGMGSSVLDLLKSEQIITSHGPMYELNPDALGEKTGATYRQCMMQEFDNKTVEFLRRALK